MRQSHMQLIALIALAVLGIGTGIAHAVPGGDPPRAVPEPATLALLASGVALVGGIGLLRRRKK